MLPTLESPELIFGICSAIGTKNDAFISILNGALKNFDYVPVSFKVTTLMESVTLTNMALKKAPTKEKYDSHIKYANRIRELFEDPGALSLICCAAIRSHRRKNKRFKSTKNYLPSHAYIFDQFKRKEEIDALRQIYGRSFILVSIYSDREVRARRLSERIASDAAASKPTADHESSAKDLVARDEDEEGVPNGQRLRDAFPMADFFVNIDDVEQAKLTTNRFLELFFGSNQLSPTRDEYGMYIAKSAALRSLDLSRQVGAAIFSPKGEITSLGCNEVPRAGGGTYWSSNSKDARDYKLGHDENERMRRALLADVVRRLSDANFIKTKKSHEELVEIVLAETAKKGTLLREALLMDLLEFGRSVHAEMLALSDAARQGRAVKGGILYCTTFPCHICAKHIVAAGISKVVFVEPYPKSYAEQLHRDSLFVSANKYKGRKVQFSPFIGVSPFRFRELFERTNRKDESGYFQKWRYKSPKPILQYTVATYLVNETAAIKIFKDKSQKLIADNKISIAKGSVAEV